MAPPAQKHDYSRVPAVCNSPRSLSLPRLYAGQAEKGTGPIGPRRPESGSGDPDDDLVQLCGGRGVGVAGDRNLLGLRPTGSRTGATRVPPVQEPVPPADVSSAKRRPRFHWRDASATRALTPRAEPWSSLIPENCYPIFAFSSFSRPMPWPISSFWRWGSWAISRSMVSGPS